MDNEVCEIEEEEEVVTAAGAGTSRNEPKMSAIDGDDIYVAVGKSSSSLEALSWALKHFATPSNFVYLIHVFPEVHQIPTPLGMLPKSKVSPQQVETFMNQERTKRREILQKLLNHCHASKVRVDTLLIESDQVAKAVLELIPVLNIRRIFVGTSKSNLRKMKATSNAELIQKGAPPYCEVKIVSERTADSSKYKMKNDTKEPSFRDSTSCICFSRKFMK